MNTLIFKKKGNYYQEELECHGNYYTTKNQDLYLSMIADIFNDGSEWTRAVKDSLLDQNSSGISGNVTDVTIENNKVIIEPSAYITPNSNFSIEIDKQDLLNLINKWQELVARECKEIIFTRLEDGIVTLSGK